MHILVTGGAGYIGSHTSLQLLKQGHQVTILDNMEKGRQETLDTIKAEAGEFGLLKVDLRDLASLETALKGKSFDAVIHFAAYIEVERSTKDPVAFFQNNVVGSQNLLKVLQENGVNNVVFSSSAAVYGKPVRVPVREDDPTVTINPYGTSKIIVEQMLQDYARFQNLSAVALRYFNPAGSDRGLIGESHQPETHLIPRLLHSLLDPNFSFTVFGDDYPTPDGAAVRDYIHILDLVDAHIACIKYMTDHQGYSVFNVGMGHGSSVLEVIKAAEDVTGQKVNYQVVPRRSGDSPELVADSNKITAELGWQSKLTLRDIIDSAWLWEQKRSPADYA